MMEEPTESREVLDELQIRRRRQRAYYLLRKRRRMEMEAAALAVRIQELKEECSSMRPAAPDKQECAGTSS